MKRAKIKWSAVPWTPFVEVPVPESDAFRLDPPALMLVNSRYEVTVYARGYVEPFGDVVHLSFKTRDRAAYHDWRDMQRLKNEICGPECEAVEIYPAESRLVDTANQYHLFVFRTYKLPLGYQERLVADGTWQNSKQRPFARGERPADCLDPQQFDAALAAALRIDQSRFNADMARDRQGATRTLSAPERERTGHEPERDALLHGADAPEAPADVSVRMRSSMRMPSWSTQSSTSSAACGRRTSDGYRPIS